jgi:AraC-like DNA-binding protein
MVTSQRVPAFDLERLRARVLDLAIPETRRSFQDPALCILHCSEPTRFVKAPTYGVTLGVVVQGAKTLATSGRTFRVDRRQAVVITLDTELEAVITDASPHRPYLALSVLFGPEQVARALVALTDAGAPPIVETAPAFELPLEHHLIDAVERLLRTFDDPLDRKLIAPLVSDEILFRLLRSDAAAAVRAGVGSRDDATPILESMRFIRGNYVAKHSVDQLARRVAMSPSHFAHRFTAVARVSPMRFVREVRLAAACALLGAPGARAGDVGTRVGFESPAHFAREFKRRFGVAPSRYRPG